MPQAEIRLLRPTSAQEQRPCATSSGQMMRVANRVLGVDGIAIIASGLATEFDTLLRAPWPHHVAQHPTGSGPMDKDPAAPRLAAGFA